VHQVGDQSGLYYDARSANRQDVTKLIVISSKFVNVPKNGFQRKIKISNIEVDEHQSCTVQTQRMTLRYLRDMSEISQRYE